jgi:triosephosphate isomerase
VPITGDISAEMIADCLAGYVLVGHSERRTLHGEARAMRPSAPRRRPRKLAGWSSVICIGETEAERKAGETLEGSGNQQLAGSVPDGATAKPTPSLPMSRSGRSAPA